MKNVEASVEITKKVHGMGMRLSIEDFRTGYSSARRAARGGPPKD